MIKFWTFMAIVFVVFGGGFARGAIVASNFPDSFQYSGFRTDIGYWSDTNNHPSNTADSQKFVPTQSGKLSTMTLYAVKSHSGEPLRVSICSDQDGQPGTKLAELSFTNFPTSYFPPNAPTVLDLSPMGLQLQVGTAYHAVFRTDSALYNDYYYAFHVLNSHSKSFGYGYRWSPNGGTSWWTPSNLEVAMQLAVSDPLAGNLELLPTLDAKADFSNGGSSVVEGESAVNVQKVAFAQVYRRGVLEFDIRNIPDQAMITSAKLVLDITTITTSTNVYPTLSLHGYAGNGTLEIADGQAPTNLLGESAPILALGTIAIDLNPDYIESLLSTSNFLGLLALGNDNGKQAAFVTTEGAKIGLGSAPKLMISYVPEPGVFVLLGSGTIFMLWSVILPRRRRWPD